MKNPKFNREIQSGDFLKMFKIKFLESSKKFFKKFLNSRKKFLKSF